MQLKNFALTGADNSVAVEYLIEAMQITPHIDFGILLTATRPKKRYPDHIWLKQLTRAHQHQLGTIKSALYGHICGAWVTSLLKGEGKFFDDNGMCHVPGGDYFVAFAGFQLNIGKRSIKDTQVTAFIEVLKEYGLDKREWIIQIQVKRQHAFIEALRAAGINANPLYDKSGGKGIEPSSWMPPEIDGYVGYAGGLTPYNWFGVCQVLSAHENDQPFWLDMESGLRRDDDNGFDMEKVALIIDQIRVMEDAGQLSS